MIGLCREVLHSFVAFERGGKGMEMATLKPIHKFGNIAMLEIAAETNGMERKLLPCPACKQDTEHACIKLLAICLTCGQGSAIQLSA